MQGILLTALELFCTFLLCGSLWTDSWRSFCFQQEICTLICLWFSVNTPQNQPQKSLGSDGYGLTQVLMCGFSKAQGCKQFMEEVLHQIVPLEEGSWTFSVASLRIGCNLEITSHNICWAWKAPFRIIQLNFPAQNRVNYIYPRLLRDCPVMFTVSWRMKTVQPLWTTRFKWHFPSFHFCPLPTAASPFTEKSLALCSFLPHNIRYL